MKLRKTGVTTALRQVLSDMGLILNNKVFSDSRTHGYIGVKVCGLKLPSEPIQEEIIKRLKDLGFECKSIKYNTYNRSISSGTRFTIHRKQIIPPYQPKKDIVYSSQIKNENMNNIKLESKLEFFNLSAPVEIGPLKVKLLAQVVVDEGKIYSHELIKIDNPTYNGMKISDWRKFVDMNQEWGIDYDYILDEKFDEIFEKNIVKKIIEGLK